MATQPASDLSRQAKKRGQNRQSAPRMVLFKVPVNVPPEVAQFRAEYSAHARWLPPHLANVLIGAICTADAHGEDAVTTYEAISAATHTPGLQKRYKCKPVSPRQVERCMPMLRELGVLTWHSEKTRVTGWSDHYGEIRARIYLRLTIGNIERLYELAEKARHEKGVRDADRAARRAGYEQARNESRKAERARDTVVTCEDGGAINSCPTPNGGSSGGTDGGSNGGRIVPNRSFVTEPSYSSSASRDDEVDFSQEDLGTQDDQDQGSRLSLSEYGAAVCRALSEHLADPMDPWLFPAAARNLLARLWPDPQDVPARDIAYGHMEDGWQGPGGNVSAKVGNEAAVLANRLRWADEALVHSWVERGAQRLAEMEARERTEQQRQAEEAEAVRLAEIEYQAKIERQRRAEDEAKTEIERLLPEYVALCPEYTLEEARRLLAQEGSTYRARLKALQKAIQVLSDERVYAEYAEKFHDGNTYRAHRYASDQTDGRDASIYAFMREALNAA